MFLERMGACLIQLTLVNQLMNCLHKSGISYNLNNDSTVEATYGHFQSPFSVTFNHTIL